jgi:hypothetical protein
MSKPVISVFFLIESCILLSCGGPSKADKAEALYNRICAVVRNSDNSYTEEWHNIKNKIIEDKDTILLITCSDFQIVVRKTVPLNQIITDTTKAADTTKKESTTW